MENNLIVVKQLPIIEDQLRQVKASVDERVAQVLALACTEATYKDVKKARAELNKEFQDLEARRREVKRPSLLRMRLLKSSTRNVRPTLLPRQTLS